MLSLSSSNHCITKVFYQLLYYHSLLEIIVLLLSYSNHCIINVFQQSLYYQCLLAITVSSQFSINQCNTTVFYQYYQSILSIIAVFQQITITSLSYLQQSLYYHSLLAHTVLSLSSSNHCIFTVFQQSLYYQRL